MKRNIMHNHAGSSKMSQKRHLDDELEGNVVVKKQEEKVEDKR